MSEEPGERSSPHPGEPRAGARAGSERTRATYVIAAGGTGGHIFPGIALAREIQSLRPSASVVFAGTARGLERKLIPQSGFPLETVRASGFAGKPFARRIGALAELPLGVLDSWRLLRRHRPHAVAGLGAYVSVPVLAAARMLGIPTVIHESNAMPGVANRFLSRFATRVAISLPAARARLGRTATLTGTPVRSEFFSVPPLRESGTTRRLLVFGGSQGSLVLNRAVVDALPQLRAASVEVLLQTGERHQGSVAGKISTGGSLPAGVRLEPFLPKLDRDLAWADLVVSRAGAMTVAELSASGRPAILVPFGSATHGHQRENARSLVEAGAARLIEEHELTGNRLARAVSELIGDRGGLVRMGLAARSLSRPDAAQKLAEIVFESETRRAEDS
ncbi:MAG: undecaprenyldiphospho-muramoylpentapeptide beta-N-acetylglucosaminyltransferase [Thermoanaerobaculia bacterium]